MNDRTLWNEIIIKSRVCVATSAELKPFLVILLLQQLPLSTIVSIPSPLPKTKKKKNRSPTQETMAKLSSWFAVLRWALILTLILVIILSIAPIIFPRHFEKSQKGTRDVQLINSALMVGLSVYGLLSVCCYYYYLTLIFGISLLVYLIVELVWLQLGNIGIYLTLAGLIICSFTYCAAMRRLRHEALYGPWTIIIKFVSDVFLPFLSFILLFFFLTWQPLPFVTSSKWQADQAVSQSVNQQTNIYIYFVHIVKIIVIQSKCRIHKCVNSAK